MRRANRSRADNHRSTGQTIELERVEKGTAADDVDDRVDGSDFVKVNVLGIDPVSGSLDLREIGKQPQRQLSNFGLEARTFDQVTDVGPAAVLAMGVRVPIVMRASAAGLFLGIGAFNWRPATKDAKALAADAPSSCRAQFERHTFEAQLANDFFQDLEGRSGVEAGSQEHVPGDSTRTLEVSAPRRRAA